MNEIDCKATGTLLRKMRCSHGYKQQQLAEMLNVTQGLISQWENGYRVPPISKAVKLSDLYGITVEKMILRKVM